MYVLFYMAFHIEKRKLACRTCIIRLLRTLLFFSDVCCFVLSIYGFSHFFMVLSKLLVICQKTNENIFKFSILLDVKQIYFSIFCNYN
jgi:hypothetical protein